MKHENSAGAVVFRKDKDGRILYLLLGYEHKSKYLGFPRGNIEQDETEKQTAMREVKEETGLNVRFLEGFREKVHWFYRREGDTVSKTLVLFLAEAESDQVTVSEEHVGYKWLTFEQAIDQLQFENSRSILRKAQDFLFNIERNSLRRFSK
ncbi:MAG: NUDIX domain-containing protein [archaeon]|nr:MAG: NUDIX domain-containing protein [archaeon]